MHRALHTTRIVVVNSLVYGVDNSCMLDALRQFGHRARGIALIDDTISDATLDTLEAVGQIDDGRLLNQLPLWAPESNLRRKIFVENPARLYGF